MKKKIGFGLLILLLLVVVFNFSSISYGLSQGIGQIKVLVNAVPLKEIKTDPNTPDSVLQKIALIEEIRQFAIDSIGLNDSENYTTFYDQKGKAILWVVTASPEFEIKAHEWCFPIAGCFPYKGYFEYDKAVQEEIKMKEKGYDTEIGEVSAWSTLGFFKDPILSSMLNRTEANLADLIIHELTHATLYVKNNVQFNENLASFIGKQGAIYYLQLKYGDSSQIIIDYKESFQKRKLFANYIKKEIIGLNQFYKNLSENLSIEEKRKLKQNKIDEIKMGLMQIDYYKDSIQAIKKLNKFQPNNAYFSGFSTYSKEQNQLDSLFQNTYKGSLKDFIQGMKDVHYVD